MTKRSSASRPLKPIVLGTGLLALDVVLNVDSEDPPRCYAGGTCGNVLTILSYLDWHAQPISRLASGAASERLIADLHDWKVSTDLIGMQEDGSTPIIIHRIARNSAGHWHHSFSWRCPGCGAHLPGYKPVLASAAEEISTCLPDAQAFFFDRVSRGALHLAAAAAEAGAVIIFEPSGIGDPNQFREAWALAHVVKYAHERLRDIADLDLKRSEREGVLLEIETLGREGLRYRSRLPRCRSNGWRQVGAFAPEVFIDAAGAGDWCTAGLLDRLVRGGLRGLKATSGEKLQEAFRYAQALASWNCGFEGARGGMYQMDKATFRRSIQGILSGREMASAAPSKEQAAAARLMACFCPTCKSPEFPSVQRRASGPRAAR